MADMQRVENTLQGLRALKGQSLSIIRLGAPVLPDIATGRTSDASSSGLDQHDPESLKADLAHYKELFSKLRFSYLEQVTKEKFLRAVVGEPPQVVEHAENVELEGQLALSKKALQKQKQDVQDMIVELESKGRELSQRYETVTLQTELLETLPSQINGMRETLYQLREESASKLDSTQSDDPEMMLPFDATQNLINQRRIELEETEKELVSLRQAVPRQESVLEREQRQLSVLEQERDRVTKSAEESLQRNQAGGGPDELELRGRWLKAVEHGMQNWLEVQA